MDITNLGDVEVGEALPVGIRGTATELAQVAGTAPIGRLSLNGGEAVERSGQWFPAPDENGFIGVVPFPGTDLSAAGDVDGVVIITKAGQSWSPKKKRFTAQAYAHV